ncbi:hypothetical protein CFC21_004757 [Triticum aestivum]|uniref:Uncharacterized protein n=2 Tax=Triticum aestivum TaxID=4565 RepID=A0A3B5YR22_WHEAT|nr:disease resistance protein RGA4-like [Triticum aestivum]KAF6987079.1 hypothetical protein CFC21_004757 [Triticum aestivum]
MEVIGLIKSVMGCMKTLADLIEKNIERRDLLAVGLISMKNYLQILIDVEGRFKRKQLQLAPGMQLQLQELAFDIDDFIQALWVPGPCRSFFLAAVGLDSRPRLIQLIADFKDRIKILIEELPKSFEPMPPPTGGTSTLASPPSSARAPVSYAREVDLVGIQGPKMEIKELLSPHAEPHRGRLSVISIVGCSGAGKTALARTLYEDDDVTKDFDYKAWVVASDHIPAGILNKILEEVIPTSLLGRISQALQRFLNTILRAVPLSPARWSTSEAMQHFRKDKRYLVFVDDVQRVTPWKDISNAFRENVMDSRIIVTTIVPSVARARSCGRPGSYMYTVKGLDKENSRRLFRAKFWQDDGYSAEGEVDLHDNDVDIITKKCDGLPMALISTAKYLRQKGPDPTIKDFKQVSQELRDCLACRETASEDFSAFAEMRRALVKPYENLKHGEKECLLYVSTFSHGHDATTNSLLRRLIAEGLLPRDDDVAKDPESIVGDVRECLRKLMDHSMIEPVPIRNYTNVAKRCRVHSIMLEFTIKIAVSRNFMSLIHKDKALHSRTGKVRRLTVQSSPLVRGTTRPEGMDLSVLRSLAIFESRILDFQECKLVRVLDLEGCIGLTKEVLDNICGLLLLRFLSLRNSDTKELPENVKELQCLETLDTRGTEVEKLPVEVIMLPRIAYLFGKFELTNVDTENRDKVAKFFSEKRSQLHTLGGISVHKTPCLEIVVDVVQHATMLKKVKVWYKEAPSSPGPSTSIPEPIPGDRNLVRTGLESTLKKRSLNSDPCMDLDSVSVDFNGVPNTFLDFLKTSGTISSIKLRQGLGSLPKPAVLKQVSNLKKLHLFSTGRKSDELSQLQHLHCLQYLKLEEEVDGLWNHVFHVKAGGFESLIWLCFEASKLPPILIDQGAMTLLGSLQLLSPALRGVSGIRHLSNLREVILHRYATDDTVKGWKKFVEGHINRPYVDKKQA